jgi:hypothetical protein
MTGFSYLLVLPMKSRCNFHELSLSSIFVANNGHEHSERLRMNSIKRVTVQISSGLLDHLRSAAMLNQMSYTAMARAALVWYFAALDAAITLPDPLKFDTPDRTGKSGPAPRWDAPMTLVLDAELSERLARSSELSGRSSAAIARDAFGRYFAYRSIRPDMFAGVTGTGRANAVASETVTVTEDKTWHGDLTFGTRT